MRSPVRFEPFLRPMVWGGRRLADDLHKRLPTPEPYGESWELSDHALHRSVAATAPCAGRTLHDLMAAEREALLGGAAARYAAFPWLVKFLDCHDWLSVQVHPDEAAVRRLLPGEGSKTEAWFVLSADPDSRVYAGLLPGTDEARLRSALASGRAAECLHSFRPQPGDCVFLPAGTVHAVGGGVLMAEVQQTSDATFRLYDWDRRDARGCSRALHLDESFASIHWDRGPVEPVRVQSFRAPDAEVGAAERHALVRCPYFTMDYLQGREPFTVGGEGRLQLLVVLRGRCLWEAPHGEERASPGQAWLLPAALPPLTCRPDPVVGALLCTLPH